MKIMTWNVNMFNGDRWSSKDHNWTNNQESERNKNAENIFKFVVQNVIADSDIAILQEFPHHEENWRSEFEKKYISHRIKTWYYEDLDKDYCVNTKYGVTVAIIKENSKWDLSRLSNHSLNGNGQVDYSNRYIDLHNNDKNINLMGAHPKDARAMRSWINTGYKKDHISHIIVGDFNAGNYIKDGCDNKFINNRKEFMILSEGYIDVCNGMGTTNYTPSTQVDHILIQNSQKFIGRVKTRDVVYSEKYSDHFPLVTSIDI